jgi:hypothetical protein
MLNVLAHMILEAFVDNTEELRENKKCQGHKDDVEN